MSHRKLESKTLGDPVESLPKESFSNAPFPYLLRRIARIVSSAWEHAKSTCPSFWRQLFSVALQVALVGSVLWTATSLYSRDSVSLETVACALTGTNSAFAGETRPYTKLPRVSLTLALDTHLSIAHLERLAVELKRLSHVEGLEVQVLLRGLPGKMFNHAPDKVREAALLQLRPFLLRGLTLEIDPPRVRALTDLLGTVWPQKKNASVQRRTEGEARSLPPTPPAPLLWVETAETGVFVDGVSSVERALGLLLRESALKEKLALLLGQDTLPTSRRDTSRLALSKMSAANAWEAGKGALPKEVQRTVESLELPVSWIENVMSSDPAVTPNENAAEFTNFARRALPPDPLEWEAGVSRLERLKRL